jgi:hypothetical protein
VNRTAMTRQERDELAGVVKMRARVAKAAVAGREADLLAGVEAQLSAVFQADDQAWAAITADAQRVVDEADARIAERCQALGIRPEFRPSLHLGWWGRGVNASKERRAELRKLAQARIAAAGRKAKLAVDQWAAERLTVLVAGALESADAREFLAALPTPEALMPPLTVAELEASDPAAG